jgi:methylase of polypeptide subunit release factors
LPDQVQFDLVVANPPHYLECPGDDNYQRIAVDINWQSHQDFFAHIGQHLTDNGVILLQENQAGSLNGVEDFRTFIESNGLRVQDSFVSDKFFDPNGPTQIYYIEIVRA